MNVLNENSRLKIRLIQFIVIGLFLCVNIRVLLGEPCYVPSGSMEPTLCVGDWVWVDKASYGALLPTRFSDVPLVNVFTWIQPLREWDERNNWHKRRMPGWREPKVDDLVVFHNPSNPRQLLVKRIVRKRKDGCQLLFYVLGDNRNNSTDSRVFGEIPMSSIVGRIGCRLYPVFR